MRFLILKSRIFLKEIGKNPHCRRICRLRLILLNKNLYFNHSNAISNVIATYATSEKLPGLILRSIKHLERIKLKFLENKKK